MGKYGIHLCPNFFIFLFFWVGGQNISVSCLKAIFGFIKCLLNTYLKRSKNKMLVEYFFVPCLFSSLIMFLDISLSKKGLEVPG